MNIPQENFHTRKRFGVINSGGTAAGMDATLEFICRYASLFGADIIGFKYGWTGLIQNDTVRVTLENTRGIGLTAGGTFLGSCSKVNVFDHNGQDYSEICYQTYNSQRLDGIFVLGGDGTSRQANELSEKYPDMKFIWISATLDRDVAGCDYTIGFYTAVENAADVITSMIRDGKTMDRHVIIECMGRHSGYVTAYAVDLATRKYGVAIDMVLVPEIKFNLQAICNRIEHTPYPLAIVISEGITDPLMDDAVALKATPLQDSQNNQSHVVVGHHNDLAYTCRKLSAVLQPHTKTTIKSAVVGYLQRTGTLSAADTFLAEQCAKIAVTQAMNSNNSSAVIFKDSAFQAIPLKELVEMNITAQQHKEEIFMNDPVVSMIHDQLSAAAFQRVIK